MALKMEDIVSLCKRRGFVFQLWIRRDRPLSEQKSAQMLGVIKCSRVSGSVSILFLENSIWWT